MSKRRAYPLEPTNVENTAWFYETRRGVDVVQQYLDGKTVRGTCMVMIPWQLLERAVDNHRAIKRQRSQP
jgi:hypothetical protein